MKQDKKENEIEEKMIDDQKMIVDLTNNVSKKFINCLAE
jgi:hypothetical protein